MDQPGFWEEFYHRKSDGIGMSDRYPATAEILNRLVDLIPEKVQKFDDAAAARVAGNAAMSGLNVADMASSISSDGPTKFLAEQARDRIIKSEYGETASTAVKEVLKPGTFVLDKLKNSAKTALSVAVTLGVYDLMSKGGDYLNMQDYQWHQKHKIDMMKGSDLHDWGGGPGREAPDPKPVFDPSRFTNNPFANLERLQPVEDPFFPEETDAPALDEMGREHENEPVPDWIIPPQENRLEP
jgi:hypothetical protein